MPVRLAVVLLLAFSAVSADAQFATPTLPFVQIGAGVTPGVGIQAGFVTPSATVFTQEGVLYVDYAPRLIGDDGRLLVGLGVGGSVRVLRILTVLADYDPGRYDLDVGFRFGPSFSSRSSRRRRRARRARSGCLLIRSYAGRCGSRGASSSSNWARSRRTSAQACSSDSSVSAASYPM